MKSNRNRSNEGVKGRAASYQHWGGCTPPQSQVQLLPKNINKPFIKRFLEWFTK